MEKMAVVKIVTKDGGQTDGKLFSKILIVIKV
jgi:hypothetical protein